MDLILYNYVHNNSPTHLLNLGTNSISSHRELRICL